MKRLYIDFDGVIMDTIPFLYSALEENGINVSNPNEVRLFFSLYDFSKIVNDENILNDSLNSINKLINSNIFEISILTHVNSFEEAKVKVEYLRKHFDKITIIIVPKEISKTLLVHCENAILIDDYSGNLKEWSECGGIPIRFSKELEPHGYIVINSLDELLNICDDKGDLKC